MHSRERTVLCQSTQGWHGLLPPSVLSVSVARCSTLTLGVAEPPPSRLVSMQSQRGVATRKVKQGQLLPGRTHKRLAAVAELRQKRRQSHPRTSLQTTIRRLLVKGPTSRTRLPVLAMLVRPLVLRPLELRSPQFSRRSAQPAFVPVGLLRRSRSRESLRIMS